MGSEVISAVPASLRRAAARQALLPAGDPESVSSPLPFLRCSEGGPSFPQNHLPGGWASPPGLPPVWKPGPSWGDRNPKIVSEDSHVMVTA